MNNIDKLVDLEKKIQYKFQNFGLLEMAMRHSSYANEHHMERLECNERLEFLGDAVLEVVSSEFLYKTFPRLPEGEMTKKRRPSPRFHRFGCHGGNDRCDFPGRRL